jgi:hypothetical protein
MKIGVLAKVRSRSSMVMAAFDDAGFKLGDVDRTLDEGYPAGRLELNCLCKLTHGQSKIEPIPQDKWPDDDLANVEVAKCLPAWYPFLRSRGFDYWIVLSRGIDYELLGYPHDDHIRTGKWDGNVEKYREVLNK